MGGGEDRGPEDLEDVVGGGGGVLYTQFFDQILVKKIWRMAKVFLIKIAANI